MTISYEAAKRQLDHVLAQPQFHPGPSVRPWWQKAIAWIAHKLHLHIHISQTDWQSLGWWIGIAAGVVVVSAILWATISTISGSKIRTSANPVLEDDKMPAMVSAKNALSAGDFGQMLHHLMESCLQFADAKGWVQYEPFRTARQYLKQVDAVAQGAFASVYRQVVETSEAVRFAGRQLSRDEASDVYARVTSLWAKDVKE